MQENKLKQQEGEPIAGLKLVCNSCKDTYLIQYHIKTSPKQSRHNQLPKLIYKRFTPPSINIFSVLQTNPDMKKKIGSCTILVNALKEGK